MSRDVKIQCLSLSKGCVGQIDRYMILVRVLKVRLVDGALESDLFSVIVSSMTLAGFSQLARSSSSQNVKVLAAGG